MSNLIKEAFLEGFIKELNDNTDVDIEKSAALSDATRRIIDNNLDDLISQSALNKNFIAEGGEGAASVVSHPELPVDLVRKEWSRRLGNIPLEQRRKIFNQSPVFPDVVRHIDSSVSSQADKPVWYMEQIPQDFPQKYQAYKHALQQINKQDPNLSIMDNIASDISPNYLQDFPMVRDERSGLWLHDVRPDNMGRFSNNNVSILDAVPTNKISYSPINNSRPDPEDVAGLFGKPPTDELRKYQPGYSGVMDAGEGSHVKRLADISSQPNKVDNQGNLNLQDIKGTDFSSTTLSAGGKDTIYNNLKGILKTENPLEAPTEDISKAFDEIAANL